jgi:hypothetical protein
MGKKMESQRFSRLLLGKANRQQETYLHQKMVAYLPQHLLLMELLLWRKLQGIW